MLKIKEREVLKMGKRAKICVSILLCAAVTVTGVILFPKRASARALNYDDVVKISVYDAIDADQVNELTSDLKNNDYNSAAKWLLGTVENMNQQYGFNVDVTTSVKSLKTELKKLQTKGYLEANSCGGLAELSKAYIVNTVAGLVTEGASQNGELPEVSKELYDVVVKKTAATDGVLSSLESYLEGKTTAVDSSMQMDALNTIVMTMQYNVGTSADRAVKSQQKEQQIEAMQNLIEQKGSDADVSADEYYSLEPEDGFIIDQSYVDKFYAVNQLQTYMGIVYDDGTSDDDSDAASGSESIEYEKVDESYDKLKDDLLQATAKNAQESDIEIVKQMNDIQPELKTYLVENESIDIVPDSASVSEDQAAAVYTDVQDAYHNTLVPTYTNDGIAAYQLSVYAEDLLAVQDEMVGVKGSLESSQNEIHSLKSKYSLLSLRTTSDLTRIYNDIDALGNTDVALQSSISTLTTKTKTNISSLENRMETLETQLHTTVLSNITINPGDWSHNPAKGYYYTVQNSCFTPTSTVQIEYLDDPELIPEYDLRDGKLLIYSKEGNPTVKIGSMIVFSQMIGK